MTVPSEHTPAVPARFEASGPGGGPGGARPRRGRVEAINILTANRVGLAVKAQTFGFWLARRPRWQAENLAGSRPLGVQLKRLNFIHTGRWVDLGRLPRFPRTSQLRGAGERLSSGYRWTLFLSNLNQGWEPYLQSFLDSFGSGINTLWGDSLDFPGYPRPQTRADLNEWISHRLPPSQLYYCAYPHLSTNDVRSLVRVHREVRSACADAAAPGGHDDEDVARLVERLQHALVEVGPAPANFHDESAPSRGPQHATGLTGFVSLMPIRPGAETALSDLIADLDQPTNRNIFGRVPGTHFARLAILDRSRAPAYPNRKLRWRQSWLLFSADFDALVDEAEFSLRKPPSFQDPWWRRLGRPSAPRRRRRREFERYLSAVVANGELREIFAYCYPMGSSIECDELVQDLMTSICPRLHYFRDYPDVTLGEIIDADAFYRNRLMPLSGVGTRVGRWLENGTASDG